LPGDRQAVTPREPAEVPRDDVLDLLQVLLVVRFDAERQRGLVGGDRALAPWGEGDDTARVRPVGMDLHVAAGQRFA
jgi:hypothetical protein